jgi:hypothetical protein
MIIENNKQFLMSVMKQSNVSRLPQIKVAVLDEGLWFKHDTANSDFNEIISAQIINKIPKVEQNKKWFNLCQNGKRYCYRN